MTWQKIGHGYDTSQVDWEKAQDWGPAKWEKELVPNVTNHKHDALYHVSPAFNRDDILRDGLHSTKRRVFKGRVHGWSTLQSANDWANNWGRHESMDVWKIDTKGDTSIGPDLGFPIEENRVVSTSHTVDGPIHPSRLTLVREKTSSSRTSHDDSASERKNALERWARGYGGYEHVDDEEFHPLHHMLKEADRVPFALHRGVTLTYGALKQLPTLKHVRFHLVSFTRDPQYAKDLVQDDDYGILYHVEPGAKAFRNTENRLGEQEYLAGGRFAIQKIEGKNPTHVYLKPVNERSAAWASVGKIYHYHNPDLEPVDIPDDLALAIRDYRKQHWDELSSKDPGSLWTTPDCAVQSRKFADHLQSRGIDAHVMQMDGEGERFHQVVKSGPHFIDWTARQFHNDDPDDKILYKPRIPVPVIWHENGQYNHPLGDVRGEYDDPYEIGTEKKTSTWKDLEQKGKEIREDDGVQFVRHDKDVIVAEVQGDHGTYTVELKRQYPGSMKITQAYCSCPWETYRWKRTRQWKKYEGRPCSHIMAALYAAMSKEYAKGFSFAGALQKENIDYPKNWEPNRTDIGKWQHGTLPTSYVKSIAMMHEPHLQTKRDREWGWDSFVNDIKENGIEDPLLLMVNDDRDTKRPKIQLEGHRRLLAAEELGHAEVPVDVRYFGTTHKDGWDLFRSQKTSAKLPDKLYHVTLRDNRDSIQEHGINPAHSSLWHDNPRYTHSWAFDNLKKAQAMAEGMSYDRNGMGHDVDIWHIDARGMNAVRPDVHGPYPQSWTIDEPIGPERLELHPHRSGEGEYPNIFEFWRKTYSWKRTATRYHYHAAPRSARESIEQHGIDYTKGKSPWLGYDDAGNPVGSISHPGNYLYTTAEGAGEYGEDLFGWSPPEYDIWKVDTKPYGHSYRDPEDTSDSPVTSNEPDTAEHSTDRGVITSPISPKHIKRVSSWKKVSAPIWVRKPPGKELKAFHQHVRNSFTMKVKPFDGGPEYTVAPPKWGMTEKYQDFTKRDEIANLAKKHGMTTEGYEQAFTQKAGKELDEHDIWYRIPEKHFRSGMAKKDARFLTQHEVKRSSAGGLLDRDQRRQAEYSLYGYDMTDTSTKYRPLSAYISKSGPKFGGNDMYGNVAIKFKPHVKDRATVTHSDSLAMGGTSVDMYRTMSDRKCPCTYPDHYAIAKQDCPHCHGTGRVRTLDEELPSLGISTFNDRDRDGKPLDPWKGLYKHWKEDRGPSPGGAVHPFKSPSVYGVATHDSDPLEKSLLTRKGEDRSQHWEAQIHGGVPMSDIDEAVFPYEPHPETVKRMEKKGIKWRVAKDSEFESHPGLEPRHLSYDYGHDSARGWYPSGDKPETNTVPETNTYYDYPKEQWNKVKREAFPKVPWDTFDEMSEKERSGHRHDLHDEYGWDTYHEYSYWTRTHNVDNYDRKDRHPLEKKSSVSDDIHVHGNVLHAWHGTFDTLKQPIQELHVGTKKAALERLNAIGLDSSFENRTAKVYPISVRYSRPYNDPDHPTADVDMDALNEGRDSSDLEWYRNDVEDRGSLSAYLPYKEEGHDVKIGDPISVTGTTVPLKPDKREHSAGKHGSNAPGMDYDEIWAKYPYKEDEHNAIYKDYRYDVPNRDVMEQILRNRAEEGRDGPGSFYEHVADHGQFFRELSPHKPPPGKLGYCYNNVAKAIRKGLPEGWRAAAGWASGGSGHVWLLDEKDRVVDPTYRKISITNHFGVPIDDPEKYISKDSEGNEEFWPSLFDRQKRESSKTRVDSAGHELANGDYAIYAGDLYRVAHEGLKIEASTHDDIDLEDIPWEDVDTSDLYCYKQHPTKEAHHGTQREINDALRDWQETGGSFWGTYPHAIEHFVHKNQSPAGTDLYRGMWEEGTSDDPDLKKEYAPGTEHKINISSFSTAKHIGEGFAFDFQPSSPPSTPGWSGKYTNVVWHAFPSTVSSRIDDDIEWEHLAGGTFKVHHTTQEKDIHGRPYLMVHMEQTKPWKLQHSKEAHMPGVVLEDLPDKQKQRALDHLKNYGVSHEQGVRNLIDMYDRTNDEVKEIGRKWYTTGQSGPVVDHMEHHGLTRHQSAGVIAALSPQTSWERNRETAIKYTHSYAAIERNGGKLKLDHEDIATADAFLKRNPNHPHHELQMSVYNINAPEGHPRHISDKQLALLPAFKPIGNATIRERTKAISILRGADPNDVLTSNKVRSFAHNIEFPETSRLWTADVHMVRATTGHQFTQDEVTKFIGVPKHKPLGSLTYHALSDMGQEATYRVNERDGTDLLPLQFQATDWEQQKREHKNIRWERNRIVNARDRSGMHEAYLQVPVKGLIQHLTQTGHIDFDRIKRVNPDWQAEELESPIPGERTTGDLIKSIKEMGMQEPISLEVHHNELFLNNGHHRLLAAEHLNLPTIDAHVLYDEPQDIEKFIHERTSSVAPESWTVYHGTHSARLKHAMDKGEFGPYTSPKELAGLVEREYDLPEDSVYKHINFEFTRNRHDFAKNDPKLYLTGDKDTADYFASVRSEPLNDALEAAHRITHPDGWYDRKKPMWDMKKNLSDFKQKFYRKYGLKPVTVQMQIPKEDILTKTDLFPPRANHKLSWEEYNDLTGGPPNMFAMDPPVPTSYITKVHDVEENQNPVNQKYAAEVKKRDLNIPLSPTMHKVMKSLNAKGVKPLIVGGAVRDALMGEKPKDIDIENYGINYDDLAKELGKHGKTYLVGKQFGVVKFQDEHGNDYDFSLPRRDSKSGVGHRDFNVEFDSSITPKEAAARRDFTMNAMAWDPETKELHDYYGGEQDLKNKVLRHTSEAFSEDPLRVLRGMQFSARYGMDVHPDTAKLAQSIAHEYPTLSKERVGEEFMKLATKGKEPGRAIDYLQKTGWHKNFPELHEMYGVKQEPAWHPEGPLETHVTHTMNAAAKIAVREGLEGDDRATLVFGAMLHDVGKPSTTSTNEKGQIISHGHAESGGPIAKKFLSSIDIKPDIRNKVAALTREHMQHLNFESGGSKRAVRRLAQRLQPANVKELSHVMEADHSGRPPLSGGMPEGAKRMLELAKDSAVEDHPMPRLIEGRDIMPYFNNEGGPHIGEHVKAAYEAQLNGDISTHEEAQEWLKNRMTKSGKLAAMSKSMWHLSESPELTPDPEHENHGEGGRGVGKGLWVTNNPELWAYLWRGKVPGDPKIYAHEIDLSKLKENKDYWAGPDNGPPRDQWNIEPHAFPKLRVKRTVDIDTAIDEGKKAGHSATLVATDAADWKRHIIDHTKGWGNDKALCGKRLDVRWPTFATPEWAMGEAAHAIVPQPNVNCEKCKKKLQPEPPTPPKGKKNSSDEQIRLYRGVHLNDPEKYQEALRHKGGLGVHWTSSLETAQAFGNVVFEGTVRPEHTMSFDEANARHLIGNEAVDDGEWPCKYCYEVKRPHLKIDGPDHDYEPFTTDNETVDGNSDWQAGELFDEQEQPVRPGSPVNIEAVHLNHGFEDGYQRKVIPWERRPFNKQVIASSNPHDDPEAYKREVYDEANKRGYFQVYRGLKLDKFDYARAKNALAQKDPHFASEVLDHIGKPGFHWSVNPRVANVTSWDSSYGAPASPYHIPRDHPVVGIVLEGRVAPEHIMTDKEATEVTGSEVGGSLWDMEHEIPIRPGAPVQISAVHLRDPDEPLSKTFHRFPVERKVTASFTEDAHDTLYPPLFDGMKMKSDARRKLINHLWTPLQNAGFQKPWEWIHLVGAGSGFSFNFDETGDLDIHLYINGDKYNALYPDAEIKAGAGDLRTAVAHICLTECNAPTMVDILGPDAKMSVQYYAEAGQGTDAEIKEQKPYAAYDIDMDRWIIEPEKFGPDFYAEQFKGLHQQGKAIAEQAGNLLERYTRDLADANYWETLLKRGPNRAYETELAQARKATEDDRDSVKGLFLTLYRARQRAYGPYGEGIRDPRDELNKLLEQWGIFNRLKEVARTVLPWEPPV